jgi:hypothetical protein
MSLWRGAITPRVDREKHLRFSTPSRRTVRKVNQMNCLPKGFHLIFSDILEMGALLIGITNRVYEQGATILVYKREYGPVNLIGVR